MVQLIRTCFRVFISRNFPQKQFYSSSVNQKSEDVERRRKELMAKSLPKKKPISNVKHILMVASGKGGVGKTTTAVNLACALKAIDHTKEIGLLDADVFGPSIPLMMNVSGEPMLNNENLMEPLLNYGVKCMSMGLLVSGEGAVVWRGLMVMQAIDRLTRQVAWGPLDCLVIDTPPGTGDTHLSLAQNLPIDGAVLVTTPQTAALQVARRGATMLEKLDIPIFGIVENMSHAICDHCGETNHIFGKGTDDLANQLNVPILESFELHQAVSESTAAGKPVVLSEPSSKHASGYKNLAKKIYIMLSQKKSDD